MPGKDQKHFIQEENSQHAKKVRFSLEQPKEYANKDEIGIFTAYRALKEKRGKSFSHVKRNVLNLLLAEKYIEAKNYLKEHLIGREKYFFYSEEGQIVFKHALNFLANYRALECILKFADQESVEKLLKQEQYDLIKTFIEREARLMQTPVGLQEKEHRNKKLLLLYQKTPAIFADLLKKPNIHDNDVAGDPLWLELKVWWEANNSTEKPKL